MSELSSLEENPCLACTVNQDCCNNLTGLTVTPAEFERCFSQHQDKIEVVKEGRFLVINPNRAAPCPNWQNGGCQVYEERPRECALFPHNSYFKSQNHAMVSARFYSVDSCPLVDDLKTTDDVAEQTVRAICEEVFPPETKIEVLPESRVESQIRRLKAFRDKMIRGKRKLLSLVTK